MENRETYIDKMSAKLKEWDAEIQKLEAKSDTVKADVKAKYHNEIDSLRKKKDEAHEKLDEIQNASKDAWEDFKDGLDSAWDSLGFAVKSAISRFK